jgi:broad specificity phosphatase PhoE
MNHLASLNKLRNRYFMIRHGESLANIQKIIVSELQKGIAGFELTEKGRKQVSDSIKKDTMLDRHTIIYSSPFKRARQTAELAREFLGTKPIHITRKLRERFFGKWDLAPVSEYLKAWEHDCMNPGFEKDGIESVNHLLERTTSLVAGLEKKYSGKKILLVSHGDPLQVLQTGFLNKNPSNHRRIKYLKCAEIGELRLIK